MLVHFLASWDLLSGAAGVEQNPKSRVQTVISGSTCLHDLNPKQGPHKEYIHMHRVSPPLGEVGSSGRLSGATSEFILAARSRENV